MFKDRLVDKATGNVVWEGHPEMLSRWGEFFYIRKYFLRGGVNLESEFYRTDLFQLEMIREP